MRGRKSKFNRRLADRVLESIASGRSLRSVCREDGMPPESTVRRWAIEDIEGFSAQYARARELQMEAMAEDLLEIADAGGDTAHARLRIDTRKWMLSKVAPKKYGDKLMLGGDKSMDPIQTIDISKFTTDELRTLESIYARASAADDDQSGT